MLQPDDVVLFQGDSITDCGRSRDTADQPNEPTAMGYGYAFRVAGRLLADHPGQNVRIFNRGISGNRVTQLAERWQQDCLDLQPTMLSVLIGVNDTWHGFGTDPSRHVSLERYEQVYRDLLQQARRANPELRLVLCEPFVLRCGAVDDAWFPEIDQRREIVNKLAGEFDATFVAFQAAFDKACEQAEPAYWAADGVHPTLGGHALMAQTWLDAAASA